MKQSFTLLLDSHIQTCEQGEIRVGHQEPPSPYPDVCLPAKIKLGRRTTLSCFHLWPLTPSVTTLHVS